MRILMSIKAEDAINIFKGKKTYELRRRIFSNKECKKVVVYATKPIGKIIGEFEIGEILHLPIEELWEMTKNGSCVEDYRFNQYFDGKKYGYAITVKNAQMYEKYHDLDEFYKGRPPQSFIYIE